MYQVQNDSFFSSNQDDNEIQSEQGMMDLDQGDLFDKINESDINFHIQEQQEQINLDDSLDEDLTTTKFELDDIITYKQKEKIATQFNKMVEKFTTKLVQDCNYKNQELKAIRSYIDGFKFSEQIFRDERAAQQEMKNQQNDYRNSRSNKMDKQVRNSDQRLQYMINQHQEKGTPLRYTIMDSSFTPLFLSHNPCVLLLEISGQSAQQLLDTLDIYLRLKYSDKFLIKFIKAQHFYDSKLELFNLNGEIKFIIKAGSLAYNFDRKYGEIMKIYCDLNKDLYRMCIFLNYWAQRRQILHDDALSEMALYCMVIDFFQVQFLVPNIFLDYYVIWSQQERQKAQHLDPELDQEELKKYDDDYYLVYWEKPPKSSAAVKKIQWLFFPKHKDIKEIKKRWEEKKNKYPQHQNNLGLLIAQFFYIYCLDYKYQKPINITTVEYNEVKTEIGICVKCPLLRKTVLTPNLMKRQNDKFISNNLYRHVRAEFERASKLIIEGNFAQLCDKIDQ
ncbi:hypothetical protein pb186bvf_008104 [Paramecium bursaria]